MQVRTAVDPDGIEWPVSLAVIVILVGCVLAGGGLLTEPFAWWRLAAALATAGVLLADARLFVPRWLLGPIVCGSGLLIATSGNNIAVYLVVLGCGEVGLTGATWEAAVTFATVCLAALIASLTPHGFSQYGGVLWPLGAAISVASMMAMRHFLRLNARLRAAQDTIATQAATDERRRLAREIHDVIAHSMTVTMLHITAARLALQDDPPTVSDAIDALLEAETQGRRSLADIRQTVGLLNAENASQLAAPAPGLDDVAALVESYVEAGVEVRYTVNGAVDRVSAISGLAVYRVIQEGLANAAKHAPGTEIQLRLDINRRKVGVCIINAVRDDATSLVPPGGQGVPGMGARVQEIGGSFRAGPDRRGWRVRADLPIDPVDCSPWSTGPS